MRVAHPLALALAALATVTPGCGSLVGLATDRDVFVVTNPAGATLAANGVPMPQLSPATVGLDPSEEVRIDARMGALHGGTQVTRTRRMGVVIADVVFTAGFGLFVDYMTGALYYFPDRVILNLGQVVSDTDVAASPPPPAPPPSPGARDPLAAHDWPASGTAGPPAPASERTASSADEPVGGDASTQNLLTAPRKQH